MTPSEWEGCQNPTPMLRFLHGHATGRQYRLFAVACCRRVGHIATAPQVQGVVDAIESYAAGLATRSAVEEAWRAIAGVDPIVKKVGPGFTNRNVCGYLAAVDRLIEYHRPNGVEFEDRDGQRTIDVADYTAEAVSDYPFERHVYDPAGSAMADWAVGERAAQAGLVRCIFRHPSEVSTLEPSWRTSDVRAIASAIYEDRAFDRLPILADALIDAGCTDEKVLAHCRLQEPHARGCWVVDLVLRKT